MTSRGGRRAGRFQMLRPTKRLGIGRRDWEHGRGGGGAQAGSSSAPPQFKPELFSGGQTIPGEGSEEEWEWVPSAAQVLHMDSQEGPVDNANFVPAEAQLRDPAPCPSSLCELTLCHHALHQHT